MNGVEVWGWACAVLGSTIALPQVLRIIRAGTSAGVALLLWQITFCNTFAWMMHGVMFGWPNQVVPNSVIVVCAGVLLWQIGRDRGIAWWRLYPVPLLGGISLMLIDMLSPAGVFGLVVLAPALVGQVGMFTSLRRSVDLTGVSALNVALAVAVQAMWGSWSLFSGDPNVTVSSGVLLAVSLVNLMVYIGRRRCWFGPSAAVATV